MPDSTDLPSLCASFSTFFADKIEKIRLKYRTDTLDHSGVISLLEIWYGISGNALRWFASYLMDRQQMVKGKECVGEPFQTKYGAPQGSWAAPFHTLYNTS